MKAQTRTNRYLGINAGRERREAASNREEQSQERRAEVFRQDVEHTGNNGDRTRKVPTTKLGAKVNALEPAIIAMRSAGMTYEQIIKATGLSQQSVTKVLARNGMTRRVGARLKWA